MKKLWMWIFGLILLSVFILLYKYSVAPTLLIDKPTPLLSEAELYEHTKVLYVLYAGDRAKILWVTYSKDAKFYKVRMENGDMGYVMCYSDMIVVDWCGNSLKL